MDVGTRVFRDYRVKVLELGENKGKWMIVGAMRCKPWLRKDFGRAFSGGNKAGWHAARPNFAPKGFQIRRTFLA